MSLIATMLLGVGLLANASIAPLNVVTNTDYAFTAFAADGYVDSVWIPGGASRAEAKMRLKWPETSLTMAAAVDGVYRRHLVASVFGRTGWAGETDRGPVVFDAAFLANTNLLAKLLPPCQSEPEKCIFDARRRDYSRLHQRLGVRYIDNLNHAFNADCEGRGVRTWMDSEVCAVGFGRHEGYRFVNERNVEAGGFGNRGVIGWCCSDLPGIFLHGLDGSWTSKLYDPNNSQCVGCMPPAPADAFWDGFLVTFGELASEQHGKRQAEIEAAFFENEVSPLLFAGKTGTDDYRLFRQRFRGKRRDDGLNAQVDRLSSRMAGHAVKDTKRVVYQDWAYADCVERLADTVLIGPDAMPKPAYGSWREDGEHLHNVYAEGDTYLTWDDTEQLWRGTPVTFRLKEETVTNSISRTITNQTAKTYVTALFCPTGQETLSSSITDVEGGQVDVTAQTIQDVYDLLWKNVASDGQIRFYDFTDTVVGGKKCLHFELGFITGGTVYSDYKDLPIEGDAFKVGLIGGVSWRQPMARVWSVRRRLPAAGFDWPETQSPLLYPLSVFSQETDDSLPVPRRTHFTALLGANAAPVALSSRVAGDDAVVPMTVFNYKLAGVEYAEAFYSNFDPTFAFDWYTEVERKADETANPLANAAISTTALSNLLNNVEKDGFTSWSVGMLNDMTSNLMATATLQQNLRIYQVNVSGSTVDPSSLVSRLRTETEWTPDAFPVTLRYTIGVSPDPGESKAPATYIRYRSATGVGACCGVGAIEWENLRMDRPD